MQEKASPKGWNGTTVSVGSKCKVHQLGLKGCRATVLAMDTMHAEISITKGNKTWNAGDQTTVGLWWLEGSAQ